MDWVNLKQTLPKLLKKYGAVIFVLLVGILLMLLPDQGKKPESSEATVPEVQSPPSTQEALEEILCQIQGAGEVRVLLTLACGEQIVYQSDSDSSGDSVRIQTVTITDGDRAQHGLVQQINPPVYLGAVVVCQGADSAAVRLAVTEAVSDATGLSTDKITVLKMK